MLSSHGSTVLYAIKPWVHCALCYQAMGPLCSMLSSHGSTVLYAIKPWVHCALYWCMLMLRTTTISMRRSHLPPVPHATLVVLEVRDHGGEAKPGQDGAVRAAPPKTVLHRQTNEQLQRAHYQTCRM